MRIPNLNVSDHITNQIRDLDQQRFKLDKQISSGQKISKPSDDGIRVGRLIESDSTKSKLTQYQRNASYASEYLNAGYTNLENLSLINQRSLEIARLVGSDINDSGAQTYGYEIEELLEEALNRLNSTHRGRALFGGDEHIPNFGNTEISYGKELTKTFSLNANAVGHADQNGVRSLRSEELVIYEINGREYIVMAKADGLDLKTINDAFANLINNDNGELIDSPVIDETNYLAYVRPSGDPSISRNKNAALHAKLAENGDLNVFGTVGEKFQASASFMTSWNPSQYYPEQVEEKINAKTESLFPGKKFDDLSEKEKNSVRNEVFHAGVSSFSQTEFLLHLDSNAVSRYQLEYSQQTPSFNLTSFAELTQEHQDLIWEKTFNEFFNNGNLILDLTDVQVRDLHTPAIGSDNESANLEGTYNLMRLRGEYRLIPMLQDSDGVWQRDRSGSIGELVLDQGIDAKKYVIDERIMPVASTPIMSWEQNIAVSESMNSGTSTMEIIHSRDWKRLTAFKNGEIVKYDGKLWESKVDYNVNRTPNSRNSDYWKELPSDYDYSKEDWEIRAEDISSRFYFMTPDGMFFENKDEAIQNAKKLVTSSINWGSEKIGETSLREIYAQDISSGILSENDFYGQYVREVKYGITDFSVSGSNSEGKASFDHKNLEYKVNLSSVGNDVIDGSFIKGEIKSLNETISTGDVFNYEGNYFLVDDDTNFDANDTDFLDSLNYLNRRSQGVFFLGSELPDRDYEKTFQDGNEPLELKQGEYVLFRQEQLTGEYTEQVFVATENTVIASSDDLIADDTVLSSLSAEVTSQGQDWSLNRSYSKNQVVLMDGQYFRCIKNTADNRNELGEIVKPTDNNYRSMDSNGSSIETNDYWVPLQVKLNHAFKFSTNRTDAPTIEIAKAGTSGTDATAQAIVDAHGNVVGLKVLDEGKYYFGAETDGSVPPNFEQAFVKLKDGANLAFKILWEESKRDPGAYTISGFDFTQIIDEQNAEDLNEPLNTDNVFIESKSISGASSQTRIGDTFSFATGSKTFLDHRDDDGKLISVSYMGGDSNSKTFIGNNSDISYMLDASNGNTEKLAGIVNSLIGLRNDLHDRGSGNYLAQNNEFERELISLEDKIIDDMGEISSKLVRMETVKSQDEEYFVELDKQISRDLEVDLSEAIMRLSRVSTAYQAAMQVGAQMLNSSLLNYL